MTDVVELAAQMGELAELQLQIAQRLAAVENSLRNMQGKMPAVMTNEAADSTVIETLRRENTKMRGDMKDLKALVERIGTLESSFPRKDPTDTAAVQAILSNVEELSSRIAELESRPEAPKGADPSITQTVESQKIEIDQLARTINDLGRRFGTESISTDRETRRLIDKKLEEVAEEGRKRYKDYYDKLQKDVSDLENNLRRLQRDVQDQTGESIRGLEEQTTKTLKKFEGLFEDTERKVKSSTKKIEDNIITELRREAEGLRTYTLENTMDLRDRVKNVEMAEENLQSMVDAKFEEISKATVDLFQQSVGQLKRELADEFVQEIAQTRAVMEEIKKILSLQRDELDVLVTDVEQLKSQVAELAAKRRVEEEELMRDLEVLEKRLKV